MAEEDKRMLYNCTYMRKARACPLTNAKDIEDIVAFKNMPVQRRREMKERCVNTNNGTVIGQQCATLCGIRKNVYKPSFAVEQLND